MSNIDITRLGIAGVRALLPQGTKPFFVLKNGRAYLDLQSCDEEGLRAIKHHMKLKNDLL